MNKNKVAAPKTKVNAPKSETSSIKKPKTVPKKKEKSPKPEKDNEAKLVLDRMKNEQLKRQLKLQRLMQSIEEEIAREDVSYETKTLANMSRIKEIYELTKDNFKYRVGKGVTTNIDKRIVEEDKLAIKIRELEIRAKNKRKKQQVDIFYNYSRMNNSKAKLESSYNDKNKPKVSSMTGSQNSKENFNGSRNDVSLQSKFLTFKEKAGNTIDIIKLKTQKLMSIVEEQLGRYSVRSNEEVLSSIKRKIGLEGVFDHLTKNKNVMVIYNVTSRVDQISDFTPHERGYIKEKLENCMEEELLLGDFIELMERAPRATLDTEAEYHLKFSDIKKKSDQFMDLIDSFIFDLDEFSECIASKNDFDVFQKIEISKFEIEGFVDFFTNTLESYFKLSYKKVLEVKVDIQTKNTAINTKIQEMQANHLDKFEKNMDTFNAAKMNICEYDDCDEKENLNDGEGIGQKLLSLKEDDTQFKKLLPKEFFEYQQKQFIMDQIKDSLVKDKKARLLQQFVRRWLTRRYKLHIRFLFILMTITDKSKKRQSFAALN